MPASGATGGFSVREARVADAAAIAALAAQLGAAVSAAGVESALREVTASDTQCAWVALDRSGAVVGWVQVFRKCLLQTGPYAEIGGLIVDLERRRSGIGRALVECAEAWARTRSLRSMRVRTNARREDAPEFYSAAGFVWQKTQRVFTKELK